MTLTGSIRGCAPSPQRDHGLNRTVKHRQIGLGVPVAALTHESAVGLLMLVNEMDRPLRVRELPAHRLRQRGSVGDAGQIAEARVGVPLVVWIGRRGVAPVGPHTTADEGDGFVGELRGSAPRAEVRSSAASAAPARPQAAPRSRARRERFRSEVDMLAVSSVRGQSRTRAYRRRARPREDATRGVGFGYIIRV